jgi:ubiquinol-cytochrome c reductase cytochrome b subunit
MIGPVIAIIVLVGLPFFAGEGEKSWKRRPVAVLSVLLIAVSLGALTQLGVHTPWSPVMDAWSSMPISSESLKSRTALERRGALVLQAKQCRNCHSLDGTGGKRGPALDTVALRLTPDQLIRQVIQGWREYACLWEEPESGRDDCPCGVSRDAASCRTASGA